MKTLTAFFIAAAFAMFPGAAKATVTWSFFETGISCSSGTCDLLPQPSVFATLTLPQLVSAGTAQWRGVPTTPIFTGDDFLLTIGGFLQVSSAFNGDQGGQECPRSTAKNTICDFNISWHATASGLVVGIELDAPNDNIGRLAGGPFGSSGGAVATDFLLGGCNITSTNCQITGFWQNDLTVAEPSSGSLVVAGLFGAWFRKRRRHQANPNPAPRFALADAGRCIHLHRR